MEGQLFDFHPIDDDARAPDPERIEDLPRHVGDAFGRHSVNVGVQVASLFRIEWNRTLRRQDDVLNAKLKIGDLLDYMAIGRRVEFDGHLPTQGLEVMSVRAHDAF